jgi:long-chain acyl-CoA synthetase
MAAFLDKVGVSKGDRIGLYMKNCPEWVIVDMAAYRVGAIVVPIYPTLSETDVHYIINDSEMSVIVIDSEERYQIASTAQNSNQSLTNQSLTTVVSVSKLNHKADNVCSFSEIYAQNLTGKQASVQQSDPASIVYTSGTTGQQKGVILTHGNFLSNITDILSVYDISSSDTALSFLPLSHVFERTAGYYLLIAKGATIYYAQSNLTVAKDLQQVKPTLIISVPRLYEKIYEKIMSQTTGLKKTLLNWALSVGKTAAVGQTSGVKSLIAEYLVFKKIRDKTGGNLRFCISGGAPLAPHLCHFFHTIGLLILEGYGLTETAPVIACNTETNYKFGTVGHPLPNVTVKVAEDGELITYGPNIMKGYWKKEKETREAFTSDGGFLTGDIVSIDNEGYISIVDRKKNLIVLSNGKNIAPHYIESTIVKSLYIDQVIVIGDHQKFLSALIVPNWETIPLKSKSKASLNTLIQDELNQYQSSLSHYETVKKFIIVAQPFTEETGELTPTLKPKRKVISKKYANFIEKLYNE